ncbi:MAG: beta-propeller fold lactonase family protein, partial [Gemmatimonadetes bacterium]|nr:beta-propeller fold lactonase family protein [Gemmatimonadota bacterium]
MPRFVSVATVVASALALLTAPGSAVTVDHFESPHVHPVEMSPDGTRLFVVHTANHELAVFDLTDPGGPVRLGAVPVGYEPVTVRALDNNTVWVVNHVSDAVSIVDIAQMSVTRTLLPGDEPTDVAFVPSQNRAFVSVSQQDEIAVYDLTNLGAAPTMIPLNQSDPRSLAVSGDGTKVYVAALDSQNETTIVRWQNVLGLGGRPAPNPPMSGTLPPEPTLGLIVRHDGVSWRDEAATTWPVPFTMLDHDVIEIDTATLSVGTAHRGVGTTLFNIAVHPVTGDLYVTNQEAANEVRFEQNFVGEFAQNRVTIITPGGTVTPVHLNTHINYAVPAGDPTERSLSLGIPLDLAINAAGTEIFVAAMGSEKVGVLDAAGSVTRRIDVGRGPTGLALDEPRNTLYVANRFESSLSVVDLTDDSSVTLALGFDPSDQTIIDGRDFLYNTETSSAHGDLACASCHVFGRMDGIAWELGDPQGTFVNSGIPGGSGYHPIKGPMVTQTLMGLSTTNPFHWRGDFTVFSDFAEPFTNVQGLAAAPSGTEMAEFEAFVNTLRSMPHPARNLDDTLPPVMPNGGDPAVGLNLFLTGQLFGNNLDCIDCHQNPSGNRGTIISAVQTEGHQDMVIPHLRNLYEKTRFDPTSSTTNVRGFGFLHDGGFGDLATYFDVAFFNFNTLAERTDVEAYMLAFGSETHPAVGAQWTMDGSNGQARVDSLVTEADALDIGLIVKGRDGGGLARGWTYLTGGLFTPDRAAEPDVTLAQLVAGVGAGTELTFTAVLTGEEFRLGVD